MNDTATTTDAARPDGAAGDDAKMLEAKGQEAIVELIEMILKQAQGGEFTSVLISAVSKNGNIGTVWSSYNGGFLWLLGMCDVAKARLLACMSPPQADGAPSPSEGTIN